MLKTVPGVWYVSFLHHHESTVWIVCIGFLSEEPGLTLQRGGCHLCLLVLGQLARTAEQLLNDSGLICLKSSLEMGEILFCRNMFCTRQRSKSVGGRTYVSTSALTKLTINYHPGGIRTKLEGVGVNT